MIADHINFQVVKSLPSEEMIALYKEAGWWIESKHSREILQDIVKGSFCLVAAFDKKKLIGMGRVISDGVSDALIQDVIVHDSYRGRHIGQGIVQRLLDFCLEKKLDWIGLVAEPGMAQFYEQFGFKPELNKTAMIYVRKP